MATITPWRSSCIRGCATASIATTSGSAASADRWAASATSTVRVPSARATETRRARRPAAPGRACRAPRTARRPRTPGRGRPARRGARAPGPRRARGSCSGARSPTMRAPVASRRARAAPETGPESWTIARTGAVPPSQAPPPATGRTRALAQVHGGRRGGRRGGRGERPRRRASGTHRASADPGRWTLEHAATASGSPTQASARASRNLSARAGSSPSRPSPAPPHAHLQRNPAHRPQAPGQLHRGDPPVRRGPGPGGRGGRREPLLHRRPARDHGRRTTPPSCASASTTRSRSLLAAGLDPEQQHPLPPGRRAGAHRALLAAVVGHRARRAQPHAPVPRQVASRSASSSPRGCSSTRCCRPPTCSPTARARCRSARTSASTSS